MLRIPGRRKIKLRAPALRLANAGEVERGTSGIDAKFGGDKVLLQRVTDKTDARKDIPISAASLAITPQTYSLSEGSTQSSDKEVEKSRSTIQTNDWLEELNSRMGMLDTALLNSRRF